MIYVIVNSRLFMHSGSQVFRLSTYFNMSFALLRIYAGIEAKPVGHSLLPAWEVLIDRFNDVSGLIIVDCLVRTFNMIVRGDLIITDFSGYCFKRWLVFLGQ